MKVEYKYTDDHQYPHGLQVDIGNYDGMADRLTTIVGQLTEQFGRGHPGVSLYERYTPPTRWCFWGGEIRFKTLDDALLAKLMLNV